MKEGLVKGEGFATDASTIKADVQRHRQVPGDETIDWGNPDEATRPVREYLKALEDSDTEGNTPKAISLTDPSSSWTAANVPAIFAYSTNYLIDLEAGIIVDVEASAELRRSLILSRHGSLVIPAMVLRRCWVFWLKRPHVPVCDKSERSDGTLSRSDFQWDEQADEYRCPEGHALRSNWRPFKKLRDHITKADTVIYRSSQSDCATCPNKARCCPNTLFRKIARSIHENARDIARRISQTKEYQRSSKDRKKVEMLFAHLKRILKLDKLRLRGFSGAQDEFLLAAIAQNLRRMAKWLVPVVPEGKVIPV